MIETYAFLAMFAVLILTVSVMHMVLLTRFVREKTAEIPDEYYAQLSPTADRRQSTAAFITRYRAAHAGIALLGLLLLGWLFDYMQQPGWDKRWVLFPVVGYFMAQWVPMLVVALTGLKHMKVIRSFQAQMKRKAVLKRRGLFDFVSPLVVITSAACYLMFVALVVYLHMAPAAMLMFIGAVTFNYLLTAITLYKLLYGRKSNPFETHAGRLNTISLRAKSTIHSATAVALFMAFTAAVMRSDLQSWMPFALAAFLTIITFFTFSMFGPTRPRLQDDGLDSSEVAS